MLQNGAPPLQAPGLLPPLRQGPPPPLSESILPVTDAPIQPKLNPTLYIRNLNEKIKPEGKPASLYDLLLLPPLFYRAEDFTLPLTFHAW